MSSDRLNRGFLLSKKSRLWQSLGGPNRSRASEKKPSGKGGPAPAAGHPKVGPMNTERVYPISRNPCHDWVRGKSRFFLGLFDRTHSRRVFPLETEIFYTIVESVLVRSTGTVSHLDKNEYE